MQLDDENEFRYTPIDWRFSGTMPQVFGIDPIIVIAFPAVFLGLSKQYGLLYFVLLAAFIAICVYVAAFTSYPTVGQWLHSLRTRYVQRGEWGTS